LLTHLINEMGPSREDGIADMQTQNETNENATQYVDPFIVGPSFTSKHNMPAHEFVTGAAAVAVPMNHGIHVAPDAATATAALAGSHLAETHSDNNKAATSTAIIASDGTAHRPLDERVQDSISITSTTSTPAETVAKAHRHSHNHHQHVKNKQRHPLLYRHGDFSKSNKTSKQAGDMARSRNTTPKVTTNTYCSTNYSKIDTTEALRDNDKETAGDSSSSSSPQYVSRNNRVAAPADGANWRNNDEDVMKQHQHQQTRTTLLQDEEHGARRTHQPGHEESTPAAIMTADAALAGLDLATAAPASSFADADATITTTTTTTASSPPTITTSSTTDLSNHPVPAASALLYPVGRHPMLYKGQINKGNTKQRRNSVSGTSSDNIPLPTRRSITRQSCSTRDITQRRNSVSGSNSGNIPLPTRGLITRQSCSSSRDIVQRRNSVSGRNSEYIPLPTIRSTTRKSSSSKDIQKGQSVSDPNSYNIPVATTAFAASRESSSSLMELTSPHQDNILVTDDGNDDVEAQKGSLSRRTDQSPSRWKAGKKETRHKNPKQTKEQSRGDGDDANIASNVDVDNYGADNQNRKEKDGTNNETSGLMENANAKIQQESYPATAPIIQGNTQKNAGRCYVCGFTWSDWDKALLIMFILSTCVAAVTLILVLHPSHSQPP
jgi:hypothetical protein